MAMKKKAQKKVAPKGKTKAARGKQDLRESKRKGTKELKQRLKQDEKLGSLKTVDSLFESMGNEDEDEDEGDDEEASSDEESSAGAFEEVGGSDDEGPSRVGISAADLFDEEDDGPDADKRHAAELQGLKDMDPEFYKFLLAEDKALLNFSMPDGDEEQEGDEEDEEQEGGDSGGKGGTEPDMEDEKVEEAAAMAGAVQGRLLDKERMTRMHSSAKDSFTAAKACLNAYHIAVRSLESTKTSNQAAFLQEEDDRKGKTKGRRKLDGKSARGQRRDKENMLRIDDDDVFSEVIEWTIANMLGVFKHHAGENRFGSSGPIDPTMYERWKRVKVIALIFWDETFMLLNQLQDQKMVEYLLRHCSSEEAISWLWPFKMHRQRYIKRCCTLWSTAPKHGVRVLAFLFLRNAGAMVLHKPDPKLPKGTQLQNLLKMIFVTFADAANRGYSWKSLSTFRFMENCIVELLRLEDACAYRLGYGCLRQLAKILKDASTAFSKGAIPTGKPKKKAKKARKDMGSEKKKTSHKPGKKKGFMMQQASMLVSWAFVRSLYLWTKAVGAVPALRPLAYPLSMIILGSIKSKLTNLQHFPFVYHCLVSLNRLAASTESLVPIASHLLKALGVAMQSIDKSSKVRRTWTDDWEEQPKTLDASVKAPEMEVLLKLTEAQLSESLVLETVVSSLMYLLTDHMGLISQSPAFPELVVPVMLHLRRQGKNCKSEALRRQLKTLKEKVELSTDEVRTKRDAFKELPDSRKFLMLDPSTPIAKARAEALKRKATEEESRVKAETMAEGASLIGDDGGGEAARQQAEEEEEERMKKKKAAAAARAAERRTPAAQAQRAAKKARSSGALPDQDKVEAFDFYSGEEN